MTRLPAFLLALTLTVLLYGAVRPPISGQGSISTPRGVQEAGPGFPAWFPAILGAPNREPGGSADPDAGDGAEMPLAIGAPLITAQEESANPPAGAVDPSAASAPSPDPRMEAGAMKADGSDSGFQSGPSAVSLDLRDYASLPTLRPLASDCRLPCYGIPRVGPASWYYDGPGWYAAIPGYLGGVVSVVVCTFPDGQANCHTFPVRDSCQCYRHTPAEIVVDLSPAAFREFQPDLRRGIVMVQIVVLR